MIYFSQCKTEYEYLDIVPPPHQNNAAADFLLTTSTVTCDNALGYATIYLMSAIVISSITLLVMKFLKPRFIKIFK